MVTGELNECLDDLEWWMILSCGTDKEMAGGDINNSEGGGTFLEGDLVEEDEVKMAASAWIKVFCGKN